MALRATTRALAQLRHHPHAALCRRTARRQPAVFTFACLSLCIRVWANQRRKQGASDLLLRSIPKNSACTLTAFAHAASSDQRERMSENVAWKRVRRLRWQKAATAPRLVVRSRQRLACARRVLITPRTSFVFSQPLTAWRLWQDSRHR